MIVSRNEQFDGNSIVGLSFMCRWMFKCEQRGLLRIGMIEELSFEKLRQSIFNFEIVFLSRELNWSMSRSINSSAWSDSMNWNEQFEMIFECKLQIFNFDDR